MKKIILSLSLLLLLSSCQSGGRYQLHGEKQKLVIDTKTGELFRYNGANKPWISYGSPVNNNIKLEEYNKK